MKRIVVASVNPVKVQAVLKGFQEMFPEEQFTASSIRVDSGVHAQPSSNEETLAGALNRAKEAIKQINEADYWVGIEGGIENLGGEISVFAWIIIKSQELIRQKPDCLLSSSTQYFRIIFKNLISLTTQYLAPKI